MDIIDKQASGFQEVRIIFIVMTLIHWKIWLEKIVLNGLNAVHYKVTDSTRIAHLSF